MPSSDYDAESRVGSDVVGHDPSRRYETLGHIAAELRKMKADGMTLEAVVSVATRVFF